MLEYILLKFEERERGYVASPVPKATCRFRRFHPGLHVFDVKNEIMFAGFFLSLMVGVLLDAIANSPYT